MNLPLFSIVFAIAFTVIIGVLMIVAFVTGFDKSTYIIGAVVVGALLSLPVAFVVSKKVAQVAGGQSK